MYISSIKNNIVFISNIPKNTIGTNISVSNPSPIKVDTIVLNAKYFPFVFTFILDNAIAFAKFPTKNDIKDANKTHGVLPKMFSKSL